MDFVDHQDYLERAEKLVLKEFQERRDQPDPTVSLDPPVLQELKVPQD